LESFCYTTYMSLGLERGKTQVIPYEPAWRDAFLAEKSLLETGLGSTLITLEHVGSTAVPGLAAKPIIDMIGAVATFNDLGFAIQKLLPLGYEYLPQRMFASRKFFPKGPRKCRTHHLNLVIQDDQKQWHEIILFRDYLRDHAKTRDAYAALKMRLAQKYADDRAAYTAAKNEFIQRVLAAAR